MSNTTNEAGYILNTSSGILHTKECGDGGCDVPAVQAGRRQPFTKYKNATEHASYKADHKLECCIG